MRGRYQRVLVKRRPTSGTLYEHGRLGRLRDGCDTREHDDIVNVSDQLSGVTIVGRILPVRGKGQSRVVEKAPRRKIVFIVAVLEVMYEQGRFIDFSVRAPRDGGSTNVAVGRVSLEAQHVSARARIAIALL